MRRAPIGGALLLAVLACGCGAGPDEGQARPGGRGGPGGGAGAPWGAGGGFGGAAAVPVEVAPVVRRSISSFVETNGTLEAENEVDVVARAAGPIVELLAEEGDRVDTGQPLARLDASDYRAQLEIARVTLDDAKLSYERALNLQGEDLISAEEFEQARTAYETARAQLEASRLLLDYTEIRAPFDGTIVQRYVNFAEQVAVNTPLFRISDFDPLLCPIRVPERDLPRLRPRQNAYLTVESWPGERFPASVLRISPVVEAATGTVKVTLQVGSRGRLRPGMFARVFIEVETRPDALVVPKSALSLESIGDTVYVVGDGVASRREVRLGFSEGDFVEIVSGVAENESVVVVGQDGLSDGTPIQVLQGAGPGGFAAAGDGGGRAGGERDRDAPRFDPSNMTPEQLERVKERMRARGMSDEQIERRLRGDDDPAGPGAR